MGHAHSCLLSLPQEIIITIIIIINNNIEKIWFALKFSLQFEEQDSARVTGITCG